MANLSLLRTSLQQDQPGCARSEDSKYSADDCARKVSAEQDSGEWVLEETENPKTDEMSITSVVTLAG